MKRRSALVGALAVLFILLEILYLASEGPRFEGKPLKKWLRQLGPAEFYHERRRNAKRVFNHLGTNTPVFVLESIEDLNRNVSRQSTEQFRATLAVRAIGSNAVPPLIRNLKAKDSRAKVKIIHVLSSHGFPKLEDSLAFHRRGTAIIAFSVLGSQATSALPELADMIKTGGEDAYSAITAMAYIGSNSVPFLTAALTNGDPNVRAWAAIMLDEASPIGALASKADEVVPFLLERLGDKDSNVRGAALVTLGMIGRKPEIVVPVLRNCLSDQDSTIRSAAVISLRRYGRGALPAIDRLKQLQSDPHSQVRAEVKRALKTIDPGTPAANR